MVLKLTDLQKTILRLALTNREAAGVTVKEVTEEYFIETQSAEGVTRERYQSRNPKASKEGWVDVEQAQIIEAHFGIAYVPTFEESFGMVTPAKYTKDSQEYRVAAEEVFDAAHDLDELNLARVCLTGPCSWSGLRTEVSAILTEEGVELARALGGPLEQSVPPEAAGGQASPLAGAGKVRPVRDRQTPIPVFIGLLRHDNPSMRLAGATALRDIGFEAAEAIPALGEALKDENLSVRLMAEWALKTIRDDC